MHLPFSWITKTISVARKLISIDKSLIPTISKVGDTDIRSNKKMKVIKLTFNHSISSILIKDITSKETLFIAYDNPFSESSGDLIHIGIRVVGDSSKVFECKYKIFFSTDDNEIFFSVFDLGKPIEVTIKYSFLKRHSFYI